VSDPRTVTVNTSDHGPVTVPEPFWCCGSHPPGGYRADIAHYGQEIALTVDTSCHGELRVLSASLYQGPFSEYETRNVAVAVEFGDFDTTDAHSFNSTELAGLADATVAFAVGPLHDLITRLQLLEGEAP
jgi:hypothetical protein